MPNDRTSSIEGALEYADVKVGDWIDCPACGQRVEAVVEPHSNLTVLIGLPLVRCIDGEDRHPWP